MNKCTRGLPPITLYFYQQGVKRSLHRTHIQLFVRSHCIDRRSRINKHSKQKEFDSLTSKALSKRKRILLKVKLNTRIQKTVPFRGQQFRPSSIWHPESLSKHNHKNGTIQQKQNIRFSQTFRTAWTPLGAQNARSDSWFVFYLFYLATRWRVSGWHYLLRTWQRSLHAKSFFLTNVAPNSAIWISILYIAVFFASTEFVRNVFRYFILRWLRTGRKAPRKQACIRLILERMKSYLYKVLSRFNLIDLIALRDTNTLLSVCWMCCYKPVH